LVKRRLTVAQILPRLHTGGVERGTLEVAAELVRHGHRSLVVADRGGLEGDLIAQGSEHYPWAIGKKSLQTLRFVPRLRQLLSAEQVDIVHVRSRLPAWIAYLAWRGLPPQSRPHFVTTFHGFYSVGRYSAIMTKGERVIAVSESIRTHILEKYPQVDPVQVSVIYRGVNPQAFPFGFTPGDAWTRNWHQEFPETTGKFLLTIVGRISRLKGHAAFIELIQRLVDQEANVHGLVVGAPGSPTSTYFSQLRRRAEQRGLPITFTGGRNDVRDILAHSDILLSLSSQPESFGRTVAEALAVGTPVVAYDHGGVGEILGAAFPEGAVPEGDLSVAVERLLQFRHQPPRVANISPFPLQRTLDDTLALYRQLHLDESSRAPAH